MGGKLAYEFVVRNHVKSLTEINEYDVSYNAIVLRHAPLKLAFK